MREWARHQHKTEDKPRRKKIMILAAHVSWAKLTPEQRVARLERMWAGRRLKAALRRTNR